MSEERPDGAAAPSEPTTPLPADPQVRRLLLVEDEDALRRALRRAFEKKYEVHEARNGIEGLKLARELRFAAVITDQRMPEMSGVEMLTRLRRTSPETVRILVTAFHDFEPIVTAVNAANVHHFFEKPVNVPDLCIVVDTLVRNVELEAQRSTLHTRLRESVQALEVRNAELRAQETRLSELVTERTEELRRRNDQLREANVRLRELAHRDDLTGLFNHRALVEQLEVELSRSTRYGHAFSVLFIDVDDFKRVNDGFGHSAGDAVLEAVGAALRSGPAGVRRSDISARYGGEEFCVLLPETDLSGALVAAGRLREAVAQKDWPSIVPGLEARITISVGVASFPGHGESVAELLRAADDALYEAKRAGKNRVASATARGS